MDYSLNNHYRWAWNGRRFAAPTVGASWHVELDKPTRPALSLRQETVLAVTALAQQFTKPILVGLSGGSDSQATCLSLIEAKIPYEVVILRLLGPRGGVRNQNDVDQAEAFVKQQGLTSHVISLDLRNWMHNHAYKLAKTHGLCNARTLTQLFLVDRYKETHAFIMAGGDMLPVQNEAGALVAYFNPTPIQQYLIANKIQGCTKLFMYTPELVAAYVNHPIMHYFAQAQQVLYKGWNATARPEDNWKLFSYFIKPMMYTDAWPELRTSHKFHGFEQAEDIMSMAQGLCSAATLQYDFEGNQTSVGLRELQTFYSDPANSPQTLVLTPNVKARK